MTFVNKKKDQKPLKSLSKACVLITAGPTQEPIDPVRFISNRSSGKMGYALARAMANKGATVILVSGPVSIAVPDSPQIQVEAVVTAEQMYQAVMKHLSQIDIFIGAAAVVDYRVETPATQKIKKNQHAAMNLVLVRNRDILAEVARHAKRPGLVIGFAAETQQVLPEARKKLVEKKLDVIIANEVGEKDHKTFGFESDENTVTIVTLHQEIPIPFLPKAEVAEQIVNYIEGILNPQT